MCTVSLTLPSEKVTETVPVDPSQFSISTAALLAFEAAVKHKLAPTPGWMTTPL
jgi:hypothetical protein